MKRTKLRDRALPIYTKGEEIMNMVTHITGGGLAIIGSIFCIFAACRLGGWQNILGAVIYCVSMIGFLIIAKLHACTHVKCRLNYINKNNLKGEKF